MTQHNSISRNEWRGLKRIDFIKSRYGSWPPQLRAAGGKKGLSHGYSRLHIFRAPPRPHSRGTQTASQSRGHNLQLLLYARRVQNSDLYWVQLAQQALGLVSDLTTQHPQKKRRERSILRSQARLLFQFLLMPSADQSTGSKPSFGPRERPRAWRRPRL